MYLKVMDLVFLAGIESLHRKTPCALMGSAIFGEVSSKAISISSLSLTSVFSCSYSFSSSTLGMNSCLPHLIFPLVTLMCL